MTLKAAIFSNRNCKGMYSLIQDVVVAGHLGESKELPYFVNKRKV